MNDIQALRILLVEDNLHDIEIARRAFSKGHIRNELFIVRDGEKALDYLYRQGVYHIREMAPRPGMILLDLNLPKVSGWEVLKQIKQDRGLKSIPVVVLTVSNREEDIHLCYNLGVNTYIQKPVEFVEFLRVINTIQEYWGLAALLPPVPHRGGF
ncbi:MAG: response regulator [Nitrospira sp.]|nr:response regulator [Candidatus Manganitrophaceae bacterium]HIL35185.1 response regulator [Candidatus Manganitrophaceae bacterium]